MLVVGSVNSCFANFKWATVPVLGFAVFLLSSQSVAQVSGEDESDMGIPAQKRADEFIVEQKQMQDSMEAEPVDFEDVDAELFDVSSDMASNLTEREVVARAKVSMSPSQMMSLDALRRNQIVRYWDGRLAQGYTEVEECFFVLVKQPCRMILRNEETGDEVRLRQKNDGNKSSEKYVPTGVGREVVKVIE